MFVLALAALFALAITLGLCLATFALAALAAGEHHPRYRVADFTLPRFFGVSLFVNLVSYAAFVALLWVASPVLAFTIAFLLGLALAFILNRGWTFQHRAHWTRSAWKYSVLYAVLYATQAAVLASSIVDYVHPALVQLAMFALLAPIAYAVQRLWIFARA
ncbi:MAG: GtrA family protein [Hyphomonadaceae bacterium]